MADLNWGKVYYKDIYAGQLREEPGGRMVFAYDLSYLEDKHPAIAHTLPLREEPFYSERGLHPFFDNLVAEGWFRNAQARSLGINPRNRFSLLLGFGYDLAGAVSIIDPEPKDHRILDHTDEATLAALTGRASLSGIQRKLLVVREGTDFRPVNSNELSTHIAKLTSGTLTNLLELEYLTTLAVSKLLPKDNVVTMELRRIPLINENALIIPRFDRTLEGKRLHHFEEFNQLLGKYSGDNDKYDGSYEQMGQFILKTPGCIPAESDKLFQRILACLLVGNTDAHFKNFAMFHTNNGLRLTPLYDLVAASIYRDFQQIALNINGIRNLPIGELKTKHLFLMGQGGFGLQKNSVTTAVEDLEKQFPKALTAIENSSVGTSQLRAKLIKKMESRWHGTFASTGKLLLKKQNKEEKHKS